MGCIVTTVSPISVTVKSGQSFGLTIAVSQNGPVSFEVPAGWAIAPSGASCKTTGTKVMITITGPVGILDLIIRGESDPPDGGTVVTVEIY